MKTKGILLVLLAPICGLMLWPAQSKAKLITIEIEAVVDSIWDEGNYLEGRIRPGDIITGWYTYDSSTPDSSPSDMVQGNYWYYDSPAGLSLTVDGFTFETDPEDVEFRIAIRNDITPWGGDIYAIGSSNNLYVANDILVESITWQLYDPVGNALTSDSLPTMPPVLDDWESNLLRISGCRTFGISAHVTSAIPEPTTILLLGLATIFLRNRK